MKIGKNTKIKKIIPTLKKHYDYWDNFIKEWKIFSGTSPCLHHSQAFRI